MKKFLVLTAIFAAMFLVISCGGSDSDDSSDCIKITPKWSEAGFDDEDEEFYMNGSYTPKTGLKSEYTDSITFVLKLPAEANKEYDFAATINPGLYVLEDWHAATDGQYDNVWEGAYLAVSGQVKVNSIDAENEHISLSLKNVKLMPAKMDRENEVWNLTGDESICLFVESSSFEK